jgi:hypothetical protein
MGDIPDDVSLISYNKELLPGMDVNTTLYLKWCLDGEEINEHL